MARNHLEEIDLKLKTLVLICFFGTGLAQETFWIAQFGDGGTGLRFGSTITIVNLSQEILNPARATVESFGVDGAPSDLLGRVTISGPEATSSLDVELPGLGSEVISSSSSDPSQLSLGWTRITTEDNLAVEVLFSIFDSTTGELLSSTSILPRPLTREATMIVNVDGATTVSSLAILNPPTNQEAAAVTINVFDRFGELVGTGIIDGCQPGERVAQNLAELVPALAGRQDFLGTTSISSTVDIAILPLRQEGFELTTQETLPAR